MAFYLQMDGVDDYIEIPSNPLYTSNAGVYEVTFRTVTHSAGEGSTIFSKYSPNGSYDGIGIYVDSAGKLFVQTKDGIWSDFISEQTIADGNIHTVRVHFRNDGTISVYLDNILLNTYNYGSFDNVNVTYPIRQGMSTDSWWYSFKGDLFKTRVYNASLQLVGEWDYATGTTLDLSGNGNHATLVGGTWLDDGEGGGIEITPTEVSYNTPTKQSVYSSKTLNQSTKQIVFSQPLRDHLTKQSIYKSINVNVDIKQIVHKPSTDMINTKQSMFWVATNGFNVRNIIYSVFNHSLPTQQIIISTSTTVADFALKQVISKSITTNPPSKQSIYKNHSSEVQTLQRLFSVNANNQTLKQEIYKSFQDEVYVKTSIYKQPLSSIPLKVLTYTSLDFQYPLIQMIYIGGTTYYQKRIYLSFVINKEIHLNANICKGIHLDTNINRSIELIIYI